MNKLKVSVGDVVEFLSTKHRYQVLKVDGNRVYYKCVHSLFMFKPGEILDHWYYIPDAEQARVVGKHMVKSNKPAWF